MFCIGAFVQDVDKIAGADEPRELPNNASRDASAQSGNFNINDVLVSILQPMIASGIHR